MKSKKTNIFITLDYELFMSNITGSVMNCMIKPLDRLIEMLDKYNIKTTIFVDAAYLLRLSELKDKYPDLQQDYVLITNQLKKISKLGHDIQLHIHPQWLNAKYENNNWKLDPKQYKLSDLKKYEAEVLFSKSKALLMQIIEKPIIAFRAGGFSIQSYKDYIQLFIDNGIIIDSSVLGKAYVVSEIQHYNYRLSPRFERYNFSNDLMKEDPNGPFFELPITEGKINLFYWFIKRITLQKKYKQNKYGDGIPLSGLQLKKTSIFDLLKRIFKSKAYTACIDIYSSRYLTYLFNKHRKKSNDFVIIGHPKNISDLSIYHLEQFIINKKDRKNFLTISSIA